QLPTRASEIGWFLEYLATPEARRPWGRAYTARDFRPDMGAVDIGFVIHGDEAGGLGPAARFALDASPGERLGVRRRGIAIVEGPAAGDRQEFRVSRGMEARWVTRDESHAGTDRPGQLALDALRATVPLDGVVHARLIGESGLATGARRHLVQEWGVPRRNVDLVGPWRHRRPPPILLSP